MQFIGFATIVLFTALAGALVRDTAADPAFIEGLGQYSIWAAAHAETLGWVAVGVIFLAGIALPPLLMNRETKAGQDGLTALGDFVGTASLVYVVLFMALPGFAYLIGMGWFAARKAAGV